MQSTHQSKYTVLEILYQLEMDTTSRMRKQRSHSQVLERKALKRHSTYSTSTENTGASTLEGEQVVTPVGVLLEESETTVGSDRTGGHGEEGLETKSSLGEKSEGGGGEKEGVEVEVEKEEGGQEREGRESEGQAAGKYLKEVLSSRGRGSSRLV